MASEREEAEALIEAFDECDDPSIEFTEAQFSQILVLARLGLCVKWPSEADRKLMAEAWASVEGNDPHDVFGDEADLVWNVFQNHMTAVLLALTEQQ